MGWSCAAIAGDVMRALSDYCVKDTGVSNVYIGEDGTGRGKKYMWEVSNKEHRDGAITGRVLRFVDVDRGLVVPSGSFRIEPDGTVSRGPKWMKRVALRIKHEPRQQRLPGSGGITFTLI